MDLEHERRLAEVEARSKSNTRRLDELKPMVEELHKIAEAVVGINTEIRHTNKDVREIKDKVDALEERPAKNWDTVVKCIITALVSGVITYILTGGF